MNLIIRALAFAANKHRNQRRKDINASPYINHPIDLANVLSNEGNIDDEITLCAAVLHDTIEDTETTVAELRKVFGDDICNIVLEVSDDKHLPKTQRKRLQIDHAAHISQRAKLVKLADKICNLRDMADHPPANWDKQRRREYFDWSKQVIDRLRGVHEKLETTFDRAYQRRPS
ncbi:HD domain-containing protein [Pseudomonadota bacterium]